MARDPFFDDLQRTLDRLGSQFDRDLSSLGELGGVSVDVSETDDAYEVTADLPGFDKDDIGVSVDDGVLRLSATHSEETERDEDEDVTYHRKERSRRSLVRDVRLPGPVDETEANATYQNGVLTVTLPKAGTGSGHSIDVE
ncbi:Hsp20/alpha crystallin family protein [Halocalculus aciditolerans]|uniref:Heat-shock protein n=1 Tax=Halocalculus aciditolerans TaxID=1383812 RepID=A0A830F8D0_9EURY|nr:Hsp20/alpha crystallin family protein [Halocalculus aciditolerans]GGL64624.1 heat-shock protein [Halocalculus aciditolerans]